MAELVSQFGAAQTTGFVLALARVGPLFLFAPVFSSRAVPLRARLVVASALALVLSQLALRGGRPPGDAVVLAALAAKELLVGLAFAFAVGVLFAAIQTAGAFLDAFTGFSYGAIVDPLTGNQNAVLAQLYALLAAAIFLAIGGDGWLVAGLARTYTTLPLTATPAIGGIAEAAQTAFAGVFAAALEVAAPVVVALFVTDAAFALVARVAPQLNILQLGFALKILVGLLLIGASLPLLAPWLGDRLTASLLEGIRGLVPNG